MTMLVFFPLLLAVGEFYRLSFIDQALARASHRAATAAGRDPGNCEQAARAAFAGDSVAGWLFDRDNDDRIGFVAGGLPDGTPEQEAGLVIGSDDGDVSNGVVFDQPDCGVAGSWIQVRAVVPVRARFAFREIRRQRMSWAVNQE